MTFRLQAINKATVSLCFISISLLITWTTVQSTDIVKENLCFQLKFVKNVSWLLRMRSLVWLPIESFMKNIFFMKNVINNGDVPPKYYLARNCKKFRNNKCVHKTRIKISLHLKSRMLESKLGCYFWEMKIYARLRFFKFVALRRTGRIGWKMFHFCSVSYVVVQVCWRFVFFYFLSVLKLLPGNTTAGRKNS